jgi:CubicO group peptidase (beta-lactamase class C family)
MAIFFIRCGDKKSPTSPEPLYTYKVPVQSDDGLTAASLSEVGMAVQPISDCMNDLLSQTNHRIHSILIVKNGKLVFEEYFSGQDLDITGLELKYVTKTFDRNTLHFQASVTKSVTSALFGMAMDKNLINSVDDPLFSYLPEYADLKTAEKDKITLAHALAMASGIPWDESSYPYTDSRNDVRAMLDSNDPIRFILSKNLVASPGTRFIYNSGTTNILGDIVRRKSGMLLTEFAKQHLFTPLGISDFLWVRFPKVNALTFASGGLYLRPRDMAKFGMLYLQEGLWNGNRIISAEWVNASIKESIRIPSSPGAIVLIEKAYGYQWWLGTGSSKNVEVYSANGWGGQHIFVIPALQMVIVFTSGGYEDSTIHQRVSDIVNDFILSAVL